MPRPWLHLIRFHGVLAPNTMLRALLVPQEPEPPAQAPPCDGCEAICAHHRPVRLSWAMLLNWVLELDLENCPNCGGGLKIIAAILEAPVVQKILTHLGLQARAPSQSQTVQWTVCDWQGVGSVTRRALQGALRASPWAAVASGLTGLTPPTYHCSGGLAPRAAGDRLRPRFRGRVKATRRSGFTHSRLQRPHQAESGAAPGRSWARKRAFEFPVLGLAPPQATTGAPSIKAFARPVVRLIVPGPDAPRQTLGPARTRA